jgi:hypothetical protein
MTDNWMILSVVVLAVAMPLASQARQQTPSVFATSLVAQAGASRSIGPRELIGAGHRQPEAESLPKRVRKTEGRRTHKQKRFDPSLGICRHC